jgi:hypothetical protein
VACGASLGVAGGTGVSWNANAGAPPKESAAINPAMAIGLHIETSPPLN